MIVAPGQRPEPQIPVQSLGHLVPTLRALSPVRTAALEPDVNLAHRPDRALFDQFHRAAEGSRAGARTTVGRGQSGFGGQRAQTPGVLDRQAQRPLAAHRLAGAQSFAARHAVKVVVVGHDDGVDPLGHLGEHAPHVGVDFHALTVGQTPVLRRRLPLLRVLRSGPLPSHFVPALEHFGDSPLIRIADGHDVGVV